MNMRVVNIGIIEKADIALNGITVLSGENNSGKSTISKVLYYILNDKMASGYSQKGERGSVELYQDTTSILKLNYENDNIQFLRPGKVPFENTFYIDSPFVIDDFDLYIENNCIPQPCEKKLDLLNKLKMKNEEVMSDEYDIKSKSVHSKLSEIISGDFKSDKTGLKYVLADKIIGANNLAAGLKTYSIIKILIENYWMSSSSLFIFDEPEIHLHPEWQVVLAELLVMLRTELDVFMLISTHSPYFLRAMQIFSKKHYAEECSSYYFFQRRGELSSTITDVTNDLGAAYASLSRPFEKLLEEGALYD